MIVTHASLTSLKQIICSLVRKAKKVYKKNNNESYPFDL